MNANSGAAIARLQEAASQRQERKAAILDYSQQCNMQLLFIMNSLYREDGTLTELPQILGHSGVYKWEQ